LLESTKLELWPSLAKTKIQISLLSPIIELLALLSILPLVLDGQYSHLLKIILYLSYHLLTIVSLPPFPRHLLSCTSKAYKQLRIFSFYSFFFFFHFYNLFAIEWSLHLLPWFLQLLSFNWFQLKQHLVQLKKCMCLYICCTDDHQLNYHLFSLNTCLSNEDNYLKTCLDQGEFVKLIFLFELIFLIWWSSVDYACLCKVWW